MTDEQQEALDPGRQRVLDRVASDEATAESVISQLRQAEIPPGSGPQKTLARAQVLTGRLKEYRRLLGEAARSGSQGEWDALTEVATRVADEIDGALTYTVASLEFVHGVALRPSGSGEDLDGGRTDEGRGQ